MKTKKQIAILLVLALIITTVPNIFDASIAVAKEAWKILSEKDLVIDEVYNIDDDIMIGRKDEKISFLDENLQLINQTEYDQIEKRLGKEWLVSRLIDGKSEFAILDQTGEVKKVLGIYDRVSKCYSMDEKVYLFATRENGQYGFLSDEKEFGFDDVFAGKEGVICAEILPVGEKNYYVKEYFENEEVWENVGGFFPYNYDGISVNDFWKIVEGEGCEFAFYNEEGVLISSDTVAESIKTQEEQAKIQEQEDATRMKEIEEEAKQLPIAEYGVATWEGYKDFKIESISVSKFGKAYLAYICTEMYYDDYDGDTYSETMYFAGVYDLDGNLQRFGELLAADESYMEEYEYESIVLRELDKKIYFYHLGTEKYIYTDKKNKYSSLMYDDNHVYEDEMILWGDYKDNVLVTNPQSDFLKEAEYYFKFSKDIARKVLLMGTSDGKELVIYDSDWNEIKKIDLSYIENLEYDRGYSKYDNGISVYDEERFVYIDVYGNDYQVSLSDYPEFEDVVDIYTVKDHAYAYIETGKDNMLYQLGNMNKLEVASNIKLWDMVIIEGQGFFIYKIKLENDQSYYGLMDFQGNLVIDAIEMAYIDYSYSIKTANRENMLVKFTDEEGNEFYYYEKSLTSHSNDDGWDDDNATRYDDIVYYSNYLYDEETEEWTGKEEKVYDNDGKLLVGHIVPEDLLEKSGWKEFIYIYKTSCIILDINQYWDGKRGGSGSTIEPLATLTPTSIPTDRPIKTNAPGGTKPEKTEAPIGIKPEETIAPNDMEPEETVAPNNISKGKIKKVKNLKGKKVKLTLKKIENAKGYQIAYATNKKFRKKKLFTSKKMTVTIRKLKKKKTYYFKVRAYSSVNGKRKYGKWSNVKKIKIRR